MSYLVRAGCTYLARFDRFADAVIFTLTYMEEHGVPADGSRFDQPVIEVPDTHTNYTPTGDLP